MADKRMHDSKPEPEGRFLYHERRLPSTAIRFKSDVRLSSFDDAVMVTWDALVTSVRTFLLVALSYRFWRFPVTTKVTGASEIGHWVLFLGMSSVV